MPLRVVRVQDGEDGAAMAGALGDPAWRAGATVLKEDRDVCVRRARLLDRDVVVKRWSLASAKRRVQALVDRTPACRHWDGARWLREIGVGTAPTRAVLRGADERGACELLVMDFLPGRTVLEEVAIADITVRQQHRLAEAIGWQIGEMQLEGVRNRDHKASNLLVVRPAPNSRRVLTTGREIAVIDCVGVSRGSRPLADEAFALLVECVGVGHVPRLGVRMRVMRAMLERRGSDRALGKRVWREVARRLAAHGDARPKVDPLGGAPASGS